jgi:hypothetical protein
LPAAAVSLCDGIHCGISTNYGKGDEILNSANSEVHEVVVPCRNELQLYHEAQQGRYCEVFRRLFETVRKKY